MQDFQHGVVRILREVRHRVAQHLAPDIDAVHVALSAAGSNISPSLIGRQAHQVGYGMHDFALGFVRVRLVARVAEWVADVVRGERHQRVERRVVEVVVDRIAGEERANQLELGEDLVNALVELGLVHGALR